jgi:hypothetical protein
MRSGCKKGTEKKEKKQLTRRGSCGKLEAGNKQPNAHSQKMNVQSHSLGKTKIVRSYPWGLNRRSGHRLLCSDGKVRAAELAESPDTFFSTPARIRVNGKWITGYMTVENETNEDYTKTWSAYVFRQHTYHDLNHNMPPWTSINIQAILLESGE